MYDIHFIGYAVFFNKKKSFNQRKHPGLSPDEIFLDSENIPGFARERFEGVIEKPLERGVLYSFTVLVIVVGVSLFGRAVWLETVRGKELADRAANNYIRTTYIAPPRGIILDRHGTPLITREPYRDEKDTLTYRYIPIHPYAFSHIIGFVSNTTVSDKARPGLQTIGRSGIERYYNDRLSGIPGEQDEEFDARGSTVARGPLRPPQKGEDISLTIDAELQKALWERMDTVMNTYTFRGGVGIIFSIRDGSILSLVTVPSFDLEKFSYGLSQKDASELFGDPRSSLFNRAVSGVFAPGSVMKPFYALAALEEGIIDPEKEILSTGSISIPDPYRKGQESVFKDWKAHGYVDMRTALAVSSDVYFYVIGGGYGDMKGLGIDRMKKWLGRFGFDSRTGIDLGGEENGIVPDPLWKKSAHPENPTWRIGDTYHVSIGQGDLMVSPLEVMRGLGILATRGKILTPHLAKDAPKTDGSMIAASDAHFTVIAEGMKAAAQEGGTAAGVAWMPISVAAKTGTAEIGKKDRVNSWFMGYAPYDDPKIGMVILMESGPRANTIGGTYVASEIFRWILDHGGIDALVP